MTSALSQIRSKRPRFPLPRYPTGWFFIEYSEELQAGQVKPVQAFGQELVLYRAQDGTPALLDAYCPHMGAHIGHGGKVEGKCVRCPFHAWLFDSEGNCTEIPYAKKIPPKAKLQPWTIQEINGMIMAWHHIDGAAPDFEIPVVPELTDPQWSQPVRRNWKIRTHNQEMGENAVDVAHFRYLHGTMNYPEAVVNFSYPLMHMRAETLMSTPKGDTKGVIESHSYGFGVSLNRFLGLADTLLVATQTPIDDEFIDVRFNFYVKKFGNDDITRGVGKAFVDEVSRQLEQDIPVWENKIYVHPPMLAAGDGPVGKYRKWSRQFYPEHYIEEAAAAFEGN